MMTAQTFPLPKYTYQDYKNWKDNWELIDGYPWALMPSARFSHNLIQSNAVFQSKFSLLKYPDCKCWVVSEFDWKINDKTVVKPDLVIVCDRPKEAYLEFPPALIIEILSKITRAKDRTLKFKLYEEQGVKYYLMANYDKHTVEIFELIDNKYRSVEKDIFVLEQGCEINFEYDKWWN